METTVHGTINEALHLLKTIQTDDLALLTFVFEAEQALRKARAHVMNKDNSGE